jgi:hypothetical protein
MRHRGWIKRLERGARGNLESFVLEDGSTYYFNPKGGELFIHATRCLRADHAGTPRPAPPATLLALCQARDRATAVEKASVHGLFPYSLEVLVERGELVPRSMVAGRELGEPLSDLSE